MSFSIATVTKAIKSGEFTPYYQPIINSREKKVAGCEVLARWQHPQLGVLSADKFISVVEDLNLLETLTINLLESVCHDLKISNFNFGQKIIFTVNCNFSLLTSSSFITCIMKAQKEMSYKDISLVLEITERQSCHAFPDIYNIIRQLKIEGIIFALDDFGTEYSDYDQLAVVRPSYIKIDKSYLHDIQNPVSLHFIIEILRISRYVGAELIIEGTETLIHEEIINNLDISLSQGYFYERAIPFNSFTEYVKKFNASLH